MNFAKMHGAGNDFVVIEDVADRLRPAASLVRALCDRHTGIGADGLIRIAPGDGADFFMDYYNADGEAAEMCGNGIRCLAKYVADHGLHRGDEMEVGTRSGNRRLRLHRGGDGLVDRVRVDMGAPILEASRIPVLSDGDPLRELIQVDEEPFVVACLSMGNPHCVLFVDDLDRVPVGRLGSMIERAPKFPARVNAEFVQVLSASEVRARVWERGVGETLACGSGACAIVVAGALRGLTGRRVDVHLPGGTLGVEWGLDDRVALTGPVEQVFTGTLDEVFEDRAAQAEGVAR